MQAAGPHSIQYNAFHIATFHIDTVTDCTCRSRSSTWGHVLRQPVSVYPQAKFASPSSTWDRGMGLDPSDNKRWADTCRRSAAGF
jgi:hypothetical protein